MRKINNSRSGAGGKTKKPFSKKSNSDRVKKDDNSFSDRGDKKAPEKGSYKSNYSGKDKKPFKKEFGDSNYNDKPKRSYSDSEEKKPYKRDFDKDSKYSDKPKRSFGNSDDKKSFSKDSKYNDRPKRNFGGSDEKKPFKKGYGDEKESKYDYKPKRDSEGSEEKKPYKKDFKFGDKPRKSFDGGSDRKPFKKDLGGDKKESSFKKFDKKFDDSPKFEKSDKKPQRKSSRSFNEDSDKTKRVKFDEFEDGKTFSNASKSEGDKKSFKKPNLVKKTASADGLTRLNKYLSNAGIASRRDADVLIQSGVVKVNGVVIDQLGYKIKEGDKVTYSDAPVKSERKVYLLLNKPKDYITTVDDPQERKTVMELIKGACKERLYPVGRLDRNTTGLLLFTNDGEITTKLTHPKFGVKKVYHVSLNKGLKTEDFSAITEGVELEDGIVKADDLAFVGEGKKEIGIEIHSGRNRIVRRLFEHLGYDVIKLDRVVFAGLTKKDLPRGKHRFLTAKEIGFLQMIG
ncbi:MAG: pseudouridine synthase [Bacteroidetes bacterium]|nr:pseudouridine synthase [Bacteroidota bacterium]